MTILDQKNSLLNHFLAELRDVAKQQDGARFRKNLERIGKVMAYEISQTLPYQSEQIKTPLGIHRSQLLKEQPLLITIFRAGIPFFQGFLEFFDRAEGGFIGAQRSEPEKDDELVDKVDVKLGYSSIPKIDNRTVIIVDPMLATGNSMAKSIELLTSKGQPHEVHIATVIAAPEGIKYLEEHVSLDFYAWTVSLDERLDERAFIYPGLGDAGDLAFGGRNRELK